VLRISAHTCSGTKLKHTAVRWHRRGQDGQQLTRAGITRQREPGPFRPFGS
jgi:type VI protein secretion system component Hcp